VLETLEYARSGVMAGVPPDLVAVDVQAALDHIGEVTGVVSSEDVLDAIFREFCVGK
jgi:tRNA modification GTPase